MLVVAAEASGNSRDAGGPSFDIACGRSVYIRRGQAGGPLHLFAARVSNVHVLDGRADACG